MLDSKQDIIQFWFEETSPQQWFQISEDFDALIRDRYLDSYERAAAGQMEDWKTDADGCLALCLLLDQFPRNMFRGEAKSYETDKQALVIAKHAIHRGFDTILKPEQRRFIYLPFEHSETLSDQHRSVELFQSMEKDDPLGYEYARRHYDVIEKFGRFPGRNEALGRANSPEEEDYLKNPLF